MDRPIQARLPAETVRELHPKDDVFPGRGKTSSSLRLRRPPATPRPASGSPDLRPRKVSVDYKPRATELQLRMSAVGWGHAAGYRFERVRRARLALGSIGPWIVFGGPGLAPSASDAFKAVASAASPLTRSTHASS